jgi:hypothetical protein
MKFKITEKQYKRLKSLLEAEVSPKGELLDFNLHNQDENEFLHEVLNYFRKRILSKLNYPVAHEINYQEPGIPEYINEISKVFKLANNDQIYFSVYHDSLSKKDDVFGIKLIYVNSGRKRGKDEFKKINKNFETDSKSRLIAYLDYNAEDFLDVINSSNKFKKILENVRQRKSRTIKEGEWQKSKYKVKDKKTGKKAGMTSDGVKQYRKENPGSKLQTAVTEKNPTGERAKRRKSYCARAEGQLKKFNIDCRKTPEKKACISFRRWRCRRSD